MNAPRRRNIPLGALFGVSMMAGLVAWGMADYTARAVPTLAGRRPVNAPAWTAPVYAELCALAGRCDTPWGAIRWYAVDSTALPRVVCPGHGEAVGCYEPDTRALTLTVAAYSDSAVVRHELMHAAIWRKTMRHPCAYFNAALGTYTGQGCD